MTLYEQTDFASDTETLAEWRHREHPAPRGALGAVHPLALGVALAIGVAFWVLLYVAVIR